ncbi:hypothetical protein FPV67DRAFT_1411852 [Lyophyllum atratum]|nr:hypothetical protein FPV67DRAFT_1411852 [Lyophyllum atratum]
MHDPQPSYGLPDTTIENAGTDTVPLLSLPRFAHLHLQHILAHPPDSVLFPFLHGLEGENHAQNTFFSSSAPRDAPSPTGTGKGARVPRYRGLVWIVCEDDLDAEPKNSDFDEDEEEEDEDAAVDVGMGVEVEVGVDDEGGQGMRVDVVPGDAMDVDAPGQKDAIRIEIGSVEADEKHMHPVVARPAPIQTANLPPSFPDSNGLSTSPNGNGIPQTQFVPARVPDGISLRNFGIQVVCPFFFPFSFFLLFPPRSYIIGWWWRPIYATLSDIVVYSPKGPTPNALLLARRLREAVRRKWEERVARQGNMQHPDLLQYNVFVLGATAPEMRADPAVAHLLDTDMDVDPTTTTTTATTIGISAQAPAAVQARKRDPNTVDFAQREKEEMRDLTKASEIIRVGPSSTGTGSTSTTSSISSSTGTPNNNTLIENLKEDGAPRWIPHMGQVFLGNSDDVPLAPEVPSQFRHAAGGEEDPDDPFNYRATNDPEKGYGYDICIECHDLAPFPTGAHLRAAEEHLTMLDVLWGNRGKGKEKEAETRSIQPRPPPNANAVIHLPFPSSPTNTQAAMNALMPVIRFLEKWLNPIAPPPPSPPPPPPASAPPSNNTGSAAARRWSSVTALMPSFPSFPGTSSSSVPPPLPTTPSPSARTRSFTSPAVHTPVPPPAPTTRTRPIKVLLYSADGYTESSVPALCLLMAVKHLSLPEAYLELQVARRRSFFVYHADLGVLRRVESRLREDAERARGPPPIPSTNSNSNSNPAPMMGRPAAKSVSFAQAPGQPGRSPPMVVPSQSHGQGRFVSGTPPAQQTQPMVAVTGRPRANTSPWLPSVIGDHQSWFNDPRFDGSFPSRVLPFLYLGNLNHAANAYMLHALGITHVVSVGECALVPPTHHQHGHGQGPYHSSLPSPFHHPGPPGAHYVQGKSPGQGSLWFEEREGRIKVLDIKGVCDDGIDTLEPQLEPICDWIDQARVEGGQVLVHCRVGVSRSATVVIAYVMKHLGLPLVDAYLIVRSRRLSVLIQPNMRLLYNLCGWEIKLAKARAGEEEENLRRELARTLSWPYLAKEVHALNEKYLH